MWLVCSIPRCPKVSCRKLWVVWDVLFPRVRSGVGLPPALGWAGFIVEGCFVTAPKKKQDRHLSAAQMAYVLWAATPEGQRKPETQAGLAEHLGVSYVTIWRWARDPRVTEAVRFVVIQNAGDPLRVGQILDMIHEVAMERRDLKYAETWLKATGVVNSWSRANTIMDLAAEISEDSLEFTDFSDEELVRIRDLRAAQELEDLAIKRAKSKSAPGGPVISPVAASDGSDGP